MYCAVPRILPLYGFGRVRLFFTCILQVSAKLHAPDELSIRFTFTLCSAIP